MNDSTKSNNFLCPVCDQELSSEMYDVICKKCNKTFARIRQDVIIFYDCLEKTGFFEKQAVERLSEKYSAYTYEDFKNSLNKRELYNMDLLNKKVGITRKLWWEEYLGTINNKDILEVGCGVNYLVPYWLYSENNVTAFDICEESVFLTKNILNRMGLSTNRLTLFVADAEKIMFKKKFDIINISNVLHHIKNKKSVLLKFKNALRENGKLLIVEPNYYYPFRWIIETDVFDPFNFAKIFFQKKNLIEEGEKAIKFKELKSTLREIGFRIDVELKDSNYFGYGTIYFFDNHPRLVKLIYKMDEHLISRILPKVFTPFEYLIMSER